MDQYPVKHEPDEDVDHVEGDGVEPEQDVGGEGGESPGEHALGDGLQQDGVRDHGRAQLDPAVNKTRLHSCHDPSCQQNEVTQVFHDPAQPGSTQYFCISMVVPLLKNVYWSKSTFLEQRQGCI